jgi:hypothetical protein
MELAFHELSSEKQISQALVTVAVSFRFSKILMSEKFPRNYFLNLFLSSFLAVQGKPRVHVYSHANEFWTNEEPL